MRAFLTVGVACLPAPGAQGTGLAFAVYSTLLAGIWEVGDILLRFGRTGRERREHSTVGLPLSPATVTGHLLHWREPAAPLGVAHLECRLDTSCQPSPQVPRTRDIHRR